MAEEFTPPIHDRFVPSRVLPDIVTPNFNRSVGDALRGQWGYRYGTWIRNIGIDMQYTHAESPPGWNVADHITIEELLNTPSITEAKNPEHLAAIRQSIAWTNEDRSRMAGATFGENFFASFLDPVNAVLLPVLPASTWLGSVRNAALTLGATELAIDTMRATHDPTNQWWELPANVGGATVFAGMFGAVVGLPRLLSSTSYSNAVKSADAHVQGWINIIGDRSPDDIRAMGPKENRTYGQYDAMWIREEVDRMHKEQEAGNPIDNSKLRDLEDEMAARLLETDGEEILTNPYNYADKGSWFTNSLLFRAVPTPMKRLLQGNYPNAVKKFALEMVNDSAQALRLHRFGFTLPASIFQRVKLFEGELALLYGDMIKTWGRSIGKQDINTFMDYNITNMTRKIPGLKRGVEGETIESFGAAVARRRILNEPQPDDASSEMAKLIDAFFQRWEDRMVDTGMIGLDKKIRDEIAAVRQHINEVDERLGGREFSNRMYEQRLKEEQLRRYERIQTLEAQLRMLERERLVARRDEPFWARFWRFDQIRTNKQAFVTKLFDWYKVPENRHRWDWKQVTRQEGGELTPRMKELGFKYVDDILHKPKLNEAGEYELQPVLDRETVALPQSDDGLWKWLESVVDDMIDNTNRLGSEEENYFGFGRARSEKYRALTIPNNLVVDFIELDPMKVMRAFLNKNAGRYEFNRRFEGKNYREKLHEMIVEARAAGAKPDQINKMRRDLEVLYRRITNTVLESPDRWDFRVAEVLRNWAAFNYLGSAGSTTIPEFGKIVMEHGLGDTMKGFLSVLDNPSVRLSTGELRVSGEGLEILMGAAHMKFQEDNINPLRGNWMDKAKEGFYALNLLAPATHLMKKFDGILQTHEIVRISKAFVDGKASEMELTRLAKLGISRETMTYIARNAPVEQTEKGLYLANTDKWDNPKAIEEFRIGLQSSVANTIIMGTPADKPILSDGVIYIPEHIAKRFGYDNAAKHPSTPGYVRYEAGILTMPLQFYSYAFGAMNKLTLAFAQGQVKSRWAGLFISIGLGYMLARNRINEFVWDEMNYRDKLFRAIDYSGIGALYSDMVYTAIATSMHLGGPNPTGGVVAPKYPAKPSVMDAITGIAGAAPSISTDMVRGLYEMVAGDFGDGVRQAAMSLPFMRLWMIKDDANQLTRALAGRF